jgi:hypothetical protein
MDLTNVLKSAYTQLEGKSKNLSVFQQESWKTFSGMGIPAPKHEEWKYVPVKSLFKNEMNIAVEQTQLDAATITMAVFKIINL